MVNRGENLSVHITEHFKGGDGVVFIKDLTAGKKPANVRVCNEMVLLKNSSIGFHRHEGDSEIIYILEGEGLYRDGEQDMIVRAGDTLICCSGESHSLRNELEQPLKYLAFIVTE